MTKTHYLAVGGVLALLAMLFAKQSNASTAPVSPSLPVPAATPSQQAHAIATPASPSAASPVAAWQAGRLAPAEIWKSQANQTISQALNQPEFIQKLALTDWQCSETDCHFEVGPGPQAGSLAASVSGLMQHFNTDTEIRMGMSGMGKGPAGIRAQLVYYREAQPAPRYTGKQMNEAIEQGMAFQRQEQAPKR